MRGEGEDVREHAAVREHLGRVAHPVDERLVEPVRLDHLAGVVEEDGPGVAQPRPDRREALTPLDGEVVGAALHRRVPHVHLTHEPRQERPERRVVVDSFDRDLDRRVELLLREPACTFDDLADEPYVVLHHLGHQVHRAHLVSRRQPEAAGWVEVHAVRRVELDARG